MPFARPTLADLDARAAADIAARMPGADALPRRSALGVLGRVHAGATHGLYGYLDWAARQVMPDTAEAEYLDRWAAVWGVSRTAAGYASGNVTFAGTDGAVVPAGTQLQRGDGVLYALAEEVEITAGMATGAVGAVDLGTAGNAAAATLLVLVSPVSGVQSSAVVATGGIVGGADVESDPTLLTRVLARVQQPPHGGADFDWATWTFDRVSHGVPVSRYWVSPQEMGIGTMTVRVMVEDAGAPGGERLPTDEELTAIADYLDTVRPVTVHEFYVVAPIADPLTVTLSGLTPATAAVGAAIEAELIDLIGREAVPGGILLISHIREAISRAAGEWDHVLVAPTANVTTYTGHIVTFGGLQAT